MLIRGRSTRVSQPTGAVEIDWANPISAELRYGVNFAAGSGDVVSSALGAVADSGDAGVRAGSVGLALTAANGVRTIQNPNGVLLNTGPITHLVFCEATAFDNFGGILSVSNGSGVAAFGIQQNGTSGNIAVYRDNDANHAVTGGVAAITGAGKPVVVVARSAARSSGAAGSFAVNGTFLTTANLGSPGTLATGAVRTVYLGERTANVNNSVNGKIYLHLMWSRYLSDDEVLEASANPWQLFRPAERRVWLSDVAGGGGGVTGSLNATEAGSDTLASSGTVLVSGALTVTESGADTFAATGTTTGGVSGSLDATEAGADTAALSGVVLVAGSLSVTEGGPDTFAASGAVVVTGLLSATESGPDTFAALGVTASVSGSLNATEQGSDTAEIRSREQVADEGRGFVMVDRPSALWWKRKPKALPEEVAEQQVRRVVRVIKEIAGKQQPEQSAKQTQREVAQAVAPLLAEMPGFDWTPLYRNIVADFDRQREEAARTEAVAQIARIRALEQDDDDVLVLLMSF